ncbi:MAG: MarR family transcriptional regulator [Deltaproteobacteria bacterium]|nr:MarR family transcriptional regulator [Deltaproteobacteria bacterium]
MPDTTGELWTAAYDKYCSSLFRHLTFIDRKMHQELNDRLEVAGYAGVKKKFIRVIPYVGREGATATELAKLHRMPLPTMAKLVNDVVAQKYVLKRDDPSDSRVKRLFLTKRGLRMAVDAIKISREILDSFQNGLGKEVYAEFSGCVAKVSRALDIATPPIQQYPEVRRHYERGKLQLQLYQIHKYVESTIFERNLEAGFSKMQNSFGIVLSNIDDEGTRIGDIARAENVTKQSISEIANKTIRAGYVEKIPDPTDGRSQRLVFTGLGRQLITHSMTQLDEIERRLAADIGQETLDHFLRTAARIWQFMGGVGPRPKGPAFSNASAVEGLLEDWMKLLYTMLLDRDDVSMAEVLVFDKDGFFLKPDIVRHLSNLDYTSFSGGDHENMRKLLEKLRAKTR